MWFRQRGGRSGLHRAAHIADIVGRQSELAELDAFVENDAVDHRALVLTGDAGIGKSTLWEAGVRAARRRGLRVLAARPNQPEVQLAFAGLADLIAGVDLADLDGVPEPQRRALAVAVLRVEEGDEPLAPFAVSAGLASTLRVLAERGHLLVAVDDVPWLDRSSADALAFAARRARDHPIRFLLTHRSGTPHPLEQALEPDGVRRLDVTGLSFGATRLLLLERLGLTVPRRILRTLFDLTEGNPLFALELGRTLGAKGVPTALTELSLPDRIDEQFGERIEALPAPVRRALLAVGLAGGMPATDLTAILGHDAVEDAVDAGLLVLVGDRLRPSHPLLARSAKRHSSAREQRDLHLELGRVSGDESVRAHHMARATAGPDAGLARTIVQAADHAYARGATHDAVELGEEALRLTPPTSAEWSSRLVGLAERLMVSGEHARARELVVSAFERLPEGSTRARAHLLLADLFEQVEDAGRHLQDALAQSAGVPALHATASARWSRYLVAARVERIQEAERVALEALPEAQGAGSEVEREVLHALALARMLRGEPFDDVRAWFESASPDAFHLVRGVERLAAARVAMRGGLVEARTTIQRLIAIADARGEAWSSMFLLSQLVWLESWAGEWETAARLLDEWDASPDRALLVTQAYDRCRALVAAGRGSLEEARERAADAISGAEARGLRGDLLDALHARGMTELLAHEPERAAASLGTVWEHTVREGVDEPGAFPVAPDLVEALVELGQFAEARQVADRLRRLARAQEHPWGLATARRCDGLIELASGGDAERAAAELRAAEQVYAQLGFRFDRARTLLALGRALRRRRKRAAGRASLEESAAAFDAIGSTGWAERAREELTRVSGRRRSAANELTESERRAAELAARGLSNKEIAAALFVTVHTVELHLSRSYAKLGVRSRAQLQARLAGGQSGEHA
jgi:DNA-binding CsgD family transcriptional regulator